MLQLTEIKNHKEKLELLEEFDPFASTWLVSDLESKLSIQRILLKKYKVLPEWSVLRATEYWQKIFYREFPDWRLVSSDLFLCYVQKWLNDNPTDWVQTPGQKRSLYVYCEQLLPVLVEPSARATVGEWLREHPEALARWGGWFLLAERLWDHLQSEKLIPQSWAIAMLSQLKSTHELGHENVYVDLSAQLTGLELQFLRIWAEKKNIKLLKPENTFSKAFPKLLKTYREAAGEAFSTDSASLSTELYSNESLSFRKYSTVVAEVKSLVAQIREWLESGVALDDIVVAAADVEEFWPVLRLYLNEEGIPVTKDRVTSLQAYPAVGEWLAKLKLQSGQISKADIEASVYGGEKKTTMSYENFKSLYSRVYRIEDLNRSPEIKKHFNLVNPTKKSWSRDDFVTWSLKEWPAHGDFELVDKAFARFLVECPVGVHLPLTEWLGYLESLCAKTEIVIETGHRSGLRFVNLMSSLWVTSSHLYILGASENALKPQSTGGVHPRDVENLAADTGQHLNISEPTQGEWQVFDLMSRNQDKTVISVSASDLSGQVQAPSLFWLMGTEAIESSTHEILPPELSRWDELQRTSFKALAETRNWTVEDTDKRALALAQDAGQEVLENFTPTWPVRLSATQLEKYEECPFQFTAEKVFQLRDLPEVDIDLDRLTVGKLSHAIVAKLTEEPIRYEYSEKELFKVIEDCRFEEKLSYLDEDVWQLEKTKYVELARRFLEFEKNWRSQFVQTKTVGREKKFQFYWDEKWTSSSDAPVEMIGFIDRIDQDEQGHMVVIDYKSTASQLTNYQSWLKNGKYQMLLYLKAIDSAWTDLKPGQVVGGFYYILRNMQRSKGLQIEDLSNGLFADDKSRNKIRAEQFGHLMEDTDAAISNIIEKIRSGNLSPQPKDIFKSCENCSWRTLCRAPHLN